MSIKVSEAVNTSWTFTFGLILSFVSLKVFHVVYREQNTPYMDEIFHVPQAKLYCDHRWTEWNPKITTLPGLYLISYFLLKPIQTLGYENFCTLYSLRFTNLIATVFNFYLSFRISCALDEKHKTKSMTRYKLLGAFNMAVFPPLYFFTFLYYTDVWSVTLVLLMYHLHLGNGNKFFAFLAGFMSVLMRQTNVIWVGLMIIDDSWNVLCKNLKSPPVQDYKYTARVVQKNVTDCLNPKNSKRLLGLISEIIRKTYHNMIICVFFVSFIVINKSIVLGDKEAHSATFHPMQGLYFLDFLAFFTWPLLLLEVALLWRKPENIFLTVFLIGLCACLSEINKLEHPYLLADNRHLAFYLWKRVFGHPVIRRLVVPSYICSGILIFRSLQKRNHFVFLVSLVICTFLNLTPQYLFELRYFIIPFVLFRLQFKQTWVVYLETVFYIAVNIAVFYLFMSKPFVWPSEPGVKQRFIW